MERRTELNPRRSAIPLTVSAGLALLFIMALLWGVQGVTPVRANPGTRYVDVANGDDGNVPCEDSGNPCASIGAALGHVQASEEILIAGGHYVGTYNIAVSSTLKGGYQPGNWAVRDIKAYPTVADGAGADAPVFGVTPFLDVTFEGLTIEGGNHTWEGGGMLVNGATVLISATIVQSNTAGTVGGGVYGEDEAGPAIITLVNSSVLHNEAGDVGGGVAARGSITLDNVEVRDNAAVYGGGGLWLEGASAIAHSRIADNRVLNGSGGGIMGHDLWVDDSVVSGNEATGDGSIFGGGISMSMAPSGRLTITNSTVSNNRVDGSVEGIGGGIDAENAQATIADTVIANNWAKAASGVSLYATTIDMSNCLVFGNTWSEPDTVAGAGLSGQNVTGRIVNVTSAANDGVGLRVGGVVEIVNSVLWGNGGGDFECASGTCTLAHSDVGVGDTTGTANLSQDPFFVDPGNGDFHLDMYSPCIDQGTNAGAPDHDLDGNPRPWDGDGDDTAVADMGAYELPVTRDGPKITGVSPSWGSNSLPTGIYVYGEDFQAGAEALLRSETLRLADVPLNTVYYHSGLLGATVPANLTPGSYRMVVANPDGTQGSRADAYTVRAGQAVDLFAEATELWTDPPNLHSGETAQVGLVVHWRGSDTLLTDVKVRFYQGHPDYGGILIGDGTIPFLAPNSYASTGGVPWVVPPAPPGRRGALSLYAIIDPDDEVAETYEDNNLLDRGVLIEDDPPDPGDTIPPTVEWFRACHYPNIGSCEPIANPATGQIMLSGQATDEPPPPDGTDVQSVFVVDYVWNESVDQWVPAKTSGEVAYEEQWLSVGSDIFIANNYWDYLWTVAPTPGVHRLQMWAADGAGNVSAPSEPVHVNYKLELAAARTPGSGPAAAAAVELVAGMSHFYVFPVTATHSLSATLTPLSGDPDLYVWAPGEAGSWHSLNGAGEVDEVVLVAPQTGYYVVQVHGYADAEYMLDVVVDAGAQRSARSPLAPTAKVPLDQPGLSPEQIPEEPLIYGLPAAPLLRYQIYLPLVVRGFAP